MATKLIILKIRKISKKYIEEKGFSSINNTDGCMEIAAQAAARMGMDPYYLYRQKNIYMYCNAKWNF